MSVELRSEGAVAIVTIDRPEVRNAVDRPTAEALAAAFRRFEADDALKVAVLTGANGTFCAGADLKAMREPGAPRASRVAPDGDGPVGPTRMLLTKPVIAAVEGHAVAGGLELAAWCDLRVAAEDAVFGVYCRRWGIPLMDGGTDPPRAPARPQPRPRPDPHGPRRLRRGGAAHGARQPARRAGARARRRPRARGGDRLAPPGGAAQRPPLVLRAVVARRRRGARQRVSSTASRTLATRELLAGLGRYASGRWRSGDLS